MAIFEAAQKILKTGFVDDNCLGRQFAQLLSGYTNAQRGAAIRLVLAMAADAGENIDVDMSNFYGFAFRQQKLKVPKPKTCWVCGSLFEKLDKVAARTAKALEKYESKNFLIGIQLSKALAQAEEKLWETAGIEWVESIKNELSREIGKRVEILTKRRAELKKPEIAVLIDFSKDPLGKPRLHVNPLFIYGKYKKLAEMPQTRWPCRVCGGKGCESCDYTGKLYATSVEERIGKEILKTSGGRATKFHGAGREDIDVRCLDWREFVLEITAPKKRTLDFKKLQKRINSGANRGKIKVSALRASNVDEVRAVKERKFDKTYRIVLGLEKSVKPSDLKKLKKLLGTISQRTPTRVRHRRADIMRKRAVKSIKYKLAGKRLTLEVKGEAGLYVKELCTGDNGRTRPSVSEILGQSVKVKDVVVVKIG